MARIDDEITFGESKLVRHAFLYSLLRRVRGIATAYIVLPPA
jgi:hypothetical protein